VAQSKNKVLGVLLALDLLVYCCVVVWYVMEESPPSSSSTSSGAQGQRAARPESAGSGKAKAAGKVLSERSKSNVTGPITTVMLRNIPHQYNQDTLLDEIMDVMGVTDASEMIDFFYLPWDLKKDHNMGYAFLNIKDPRCEERFRRTFNHRRFRRFSKSRCTVGPAHLQGLEINVRHLMDSAVAEARDHYPMILHNGDRLKLGKVLSVLDSEGLDWQHQDADDAMKNFLGAAPGESVQMLKAAPRGRCFSDLFEAACETAANRTRSSLPTPAASVKSSGSRGVGSRSRSASVESRTSESSRASTGSAASGHSSQKSWRKTPQTKDVQQTFPVHSQARVGRTGTVGTLESLPEMPYEDSQIDDDSDEDDVRGGHRGPNAGSWSSSGTPAGPWCSSGTPYKPQAWSLDELPSYQDPYRVNPAARAETFDVLPDFGSAGGARTQNPAVSQNRGARGFAGQSHPSGMAKAQMSYPHGDNRCGGYYEPNSGAAPLRGRQPGGGGGCGYSGSCDPSSLHPHAVGQAVKTKIIDMRNPHDDVLDKFFAKFSGAPGAPSASSSAFGAPGDPPMPRQGHVAPDYTHGHQQQQDPSFGHQQRQDPSYGHQQHPPYGHPGTDANYGHQPHPQYGHPGTDANYMPVAAPPVHHHHSDNDAQSSSAMWRVWKTPVMQ